jgi:hypothetical protein
MQTSPRGIAEYQFPLSNGGELQLSLGATPDERASNLAILLFRVSRLVQAQKRAILLSFTGMGYCFGVLAEYNANLLPSYYVMDSHKVYFTDPYGWYEAGTFVAHFANDENVVSFLNEFMMKSVDLMSQNAAGQGEQQQTNAMGTHIGFMRLREADYRRWLRNEE